MYRLPISIAFCVLSTGWILFGANPVPSPPFPGQNQVHKQPPKHHKQAKAKDSGSSLTGCVDEQHGHYVLADDATMNRIADLEPVGFPTEGFAKHMGHKVTVRGTTLPGEGVPVFRVRRIETVSDTCSPQAPH